jgi:5-methylthioadenosine/S-adenosylhomocysteine deaminase
VAVDLDGGLACPVNVPMQGWRDLVLIGLDECTMRLCGSDVAAVVNYGGAAAVDTMFIDDKVKKWRGELVGVDYAQLAPEGEASRRYLLERFGVTTDEMRNL